MSSEASRLLNWPLQSSKPASLQVATRREAQLFALQIVRDPEYRKALLTCAKARVLPPAIEAMLWHYAYGKPAERLELGRIGDTEALDHLSKEELAERARLLHLALSAPAEEPLLLEPAAQEATDAALVRARSTHLGKLKPEGHLTARQMGEILEAEGRLEDEQPEPENA